MKFLSFFLLVFSIDLSAQVVREVSQSRVNNFMKSPLECTLQDTIYYYVSSTQYVTVVYNEKGKVHDLKIFEDPSLNLEVKVLQPTRELFYYCHFDKAGLQNGITVMIADGYLAAIYASERDRLNLQQKTGQKVKRHF